MLTRTTLEQFLQDLYQYQNFQDYCQNGLQVEGKETIETIAFGVSFNLPFLEQALASGADALIVHHGIFGKDFFTLKGVLKEKVALLLQHDVSLFGIHLPMDAQEQYGNNAQLLSYLGAAMLQPCDVGFIGENTQGHSLEEIVEIFHKKLHSAAFQPPEGQTALSSVLMPRQRYGFLYFANGPAVPKKIAVISGGSSRTYRSEALMATGIDTYICGSVDEAVPAWSYETRTNFINIGHYWSEKTGPLALQRLIEERFEVKTDFIDVENAI